jgi:hypothetical protein
MRQRPVRLADNKHLRSLETSALPLQDLRALAVARVTPIKDPPCYMEWPWVSEHDRVCHLLF